MTRTEPKATVLLKAIAKAQAKRVPHADQVAKARKDLTEAEARLKVSGAKPKRFLATFRLKSATSAAKGTYDERRDHLITRIKALNGKPHHVSTSAWSMLTYHGTREIVLAGLEPAIDTAIDYLEVERTGGPVHAGTSTLRY